MKSPELSGWIQRYFQEYLVRQRNVSPATVAAYRDTFRLLFRHLRQKHRRNSDSLPLESLTADAVLAFLYHLEQTRGNAIRTRNARLAALRSFVHYLADWLGPELPAGTRRILAIPFKRQVKRLIGFLTRPEIEALLAATDDDTWTGRRDHLLILLLYNTGARISELLALRVQDLVGTPARQVQLQGKGRKHRTLPLWSQTQRCLRRWIRENRLAPLMPLLPNRYGEPLTRFGALQQIKQRVRQASKKLSSLSRRPISPHLFRHATAMRMLEAGVTPEVIALWLGHENLNTTHQYVEANLSMKERALKAVTPPKSKPHQFRPDDKLLRFLDSL
ncbi:MAG: tyrosine-type recombinase/integrase [Verrucomicrobia bacterium]|nr:tyrosine-type recombinase/integrase [Verrucomicrobiota bacterium]